MLTEIDVRATLKEKLDVNFLAYRILGACNLPQDDTVYQIEVAPQRIDIITGASGLDFAAAQGRATTVVVNDLEIPILSLEDLIANKRATGRMRDLADAEAREALRITEAW